MDYYKYNNNQLIKMSNISNNIPLSKRYCSSPWNNISISNFGTIKPCPLFKATCAPVYDENTNDINNFNEFRFSGVELLENETFIDWYYRVYADVREHNSLDHPGCFTCQRVESEGQVSRRQLKLNPSPTVRGINYIDISSGNTCNLKCTMCNSHNSTKWISDEQALNDNGFKIKVHKKHEIHPTLLGHLIEYCNSSTDSKFTINVKGGEPLVTDDFYSFISQLTEEFKRKTTIKVFTNATVFPDKYIKALQPFNKVQISFSIEAVDDSLYRYIRGGEYGFDRIATLQKVFKQYSNFSTGLSFTISNYNIFHLNECVNQLIDMGLILDGTLPDNMVENKPYLSPRHLPLSTKHMLVDMYKSNPGLTGITNYLTSAINNHNNIMSNEMMKQFKLYSSVLDKERHENLFDVAPEYESIFENIIVI